MRGGFEIELNEKVLCSELSGEPSANGIFEHSDTGIRTRLAVFGEGRYINVDLPIFLATERSQIVSLHRNFRVSSESRGYSHSDHRPIHLVEIGSNIALSGPDPWTEKDLVRRISFEIEGSFAVLYNHQRIESFKDRSDGRHENWRVIELRLAYGRLSVFYTGTYSYYTDTWNKVEPRFEFDFDDGVPLESYEKFILPVVWFISYLIGSRLSPSNISVSRETLAEMEGRISGKRPSSEHLLFVKYSAVKHAANMSAPHGSPARTSDEVETSAFSASLSVWLQRAHDWYETYGLLNKSFGMQDELSEERVLNTCRLLQRIPSAKALETLDDSIFVHISSMATKAAEIQSRPDLSGRIQNALRDLRFEPRRIRLSRLVTSAWEGFELPQGIDQMVEDLDQLLIHRGTAAHGVLFKDRSTNMSEIQRCISAGEALCYLLISRELPLSETGRGQLYFSRLVENYRLLCMSRLRT